MPTLNWIGKDKALEVHEALQKANESINKLGLCLQVYNNDMTTTKKINANGTEISLLLQGNIGLTDMARYS